MLGRHLNGTLPSNILDEYASALDWLGGVLCTFLASALAYYCTSKYADFLQVVNIKRRNDDKTVSDCNNSTNEESDRGLNNLETRAGARADSKASSGSSSRMSIRVVTIKTSSLFIFLVLFLVFITLDFVALVLIPLSLIIPFSMLIFVWGSVYQFIITGKKAAYLRTKQFHRALAIVVLIAITTAMGPKSLYVIKVSKVVKFGPLSIIYTASFLAVAILLHLLRWNPKFTYTKFKWTKLSERDLNTIIKANLAGILGGQALVLLKLFAEIVENAISGGGEFTFTDKSIVIVVVSAALCTILHVFSFHHMLAVLDEENIRLLIPAHRFALLLSASVGAAVYLKDWETEAVDIYRIVLYSLAFLGLLLICCVIGYDAVMKTDYNLPGTNIARQSASNGPDDTNPTDDAMFFDVEMANTSNNRIQTTSPSKTVNVDRRPSQFVKISRLWDLGEGNSIDLEGNSANVDSADDEDGFFMSSTRSILGSPCKLGPSPVQSLRRRSLFNRSNKNNGQHVAESEAEKIRINYAYPPARNTMMTKRGFPNPHTDGPDESRWEDPGHLTGQWKVRGSNYLTDSQKVDAGPTAMMVASMQWSYSPTPLPCCALDEGGFVESEHANRIDRPFMFIINFMVPSLGNYVMYYVPRPGLEDNVFYTMLNEFVNADSDQFRNDRFKLVPGVKEGGMFVRRAVGSKPALLCNKLTTSYYSSWDRSSGTNIDVREGRGRWFEVAIDVGSSRIARSIMGAVKGYATGLVLHMGFLLESKTVGELPERVLGGVDLYRPCMAPRAGVPLKLNLAEQPVSPAEIEIENGPESPPDESVVNDLVSSGAIYAMTNYDTDGYDTDGSFRSVMDCASEGEEGQPSESALEDIDGAFEDAKESEDPNVQINYEYPIPEGTMVMPKHVPNPHADTNKSFWVDAGLNPGGWKVRGHKYDHDSIKIPCDVARMKIVAMDWKYAPTDRIHHTASLESGFIQRYHEGRKDRPFLLIVNFLVPSVGNYITYLARNKEVVDPVFDEMLEKFVNHPDDEYRNARLKLIPGVLEGSYFVRKAVGAKPALLCQKLTTTYFRHDNCFEVSIDVGSSMIGARIFSAVKGFASSLVLHLGVVLESKHRHELPEQLLFGIDIYTPVMAPRAPLSS